MGLPTPRSRDVFWFSGSAEESIRQRSRESGKGTCTLSSKSVFTGTSSVWTIYKRRSCGWDSKRFSSSMSQPGPSSREGRLPRLPDRWEGYRDALRRVSLRTGQPFPSLALSFAILHEVTAIVPFIGIFFASRALGVGERVSEMLHEHDPQPGDVRYGTIEGYIRDKWREGGEFSARLGSRYGWFGFEKGKKPTEEEKVLMHKMMASDLANVMFTYVSVKVCPNSLEGYLLLNHALTRRLFFLCGLGRPCTLHRRSLGNSSVLLLQHSVVYSSDRFSALELLRRYSLSPSSSGQLSSRHCAL